MLRMSASAPKSTVTYVETPASLRRRLREEKLAKRASSLATPRAASVPLRMLPWPQFLAKLEHRRDIAVRAHIRWCMRSAIRTCESLKRAEGRCFELRPGGRGNVVVSGGMYHGHGLHASDGAGERLKGLDSRIILDSSRYTAELEENLRKLLCPQWAIPVVKRAIRAKLALDWDLENWDLDETEAA